MKTITTQLYSFKELSPEAQAKIIQTNIKDRENDQWLLQSTSEELLESLKAVCNACDLNLVDWSFGTYDRNWKCDVRNSDVDDLSGPLALEWFLNILVRHGYSKPTRFEDMEFSGRCGFTGVCFDDDVVETVWKGLLAGKTVAKAFDGVAYRFCKILEDEYEYLTSEEHVREYLDENEEIYEEDGSMY